MKLTLDKLFNWKPEDMYVRCLNCGGTYVNHVLGKECEQWKPDGQQDRLIQWEMKKV